MQDNVWDAEDMVVEIPARDVAILHTLFDYKFAKKNAVLPPAARLKFESWVPQFVSESITKASDALQNQVMAAIRKAVAEKAEKDGTTIQAAAQALGITL